MKNLEFKKWVSVAGRAVVAYVLVFGQTVSAAQNQTTAEKQSAAPVAAKVQSEAQRGEVSANVMAEKERSGGASHQGIKVHGRWTIEVRNPDGTLVTHREFENALVAPAGAVTLSQLLTGADVFGGWEVWLAATTAGNAPPCVVTAVNGGLGGAGPCAIISPGFQDVRRQSFATLSVASISGTGGVMLSGTATAGETGSIDTVSSYVIDCPPPSPCTNANTGLLFSAFTSAAVSPAISVTVGQSIAVTVTLTFS